MTSTIFRIWRRCEEAQEHGDKNEKEKVRSDKPERILEQLDDGVVLLLTLNDNDSGRWLLERRGACSEHSKLVPRKRPGYGFMAMWVIH